MRATLSMRWQGQMKGNGASVGFVFSPHSVPWNKILSPRSERFVAFSLSPKTRVILAELFLSPCEAAPAPPRPFPVQSVQALVQVLATEPSTQRFSVQAASRYLSIIGLVQLSLPYAARREWEYTTLTLHL